MGEGYDSKMGSTAQLGWEAAVLDSYWTAEETVEVDNSRLTQAVVVVVG